MPALPARFLPTLPHLLRTPRRPYIHRDLSGLQFNERVLAEARTSANPLLERLKFLAITAANLDEFFMIRYASLDKSIRGAKTARETRHLKQTRNSLLEMVAALTAKQGETLGILATAWAQKRVRFVRRAAAGTPDDARGRELFDHHILPRLKAPEPFRPSALHGIPNLGTAAIFQSGLWFKISRTIATLHVDASDAGIRIYMLDDLLSAHLGPAFRLEGRPALLRLTRDGDVPLDFEEDPAEIPDLVRSGLGSRERGRPVRLQYAGEAPMELLARGVQALKLSPRQALPAPGSLYLHGLWNAVAKLPGLLPAEGAIAYPPIKPFVMRSLQEGIFDHLKERDLLLHHPYESFDGYVNFIEAAAKDPLVEKIEQTVYRTDALSPVVEALKRAAATKKVRVLIELRARFDEMNNLRLADEMRKAGVEVAFGFGKLKVHAKVALVTRREPDGERLYTHLSTGNYNAATARVYEDLAILTANRELGEDARTFFDAVCRGEVPGTFKAIVPAPAQLHKLLLQLIAAETKAAKEGRPAYVFAKLNALVDEGIVTSLYEASQAGVRVDLLVRGACALIPGVEGLSENIRVISIVDRFLEHSRIYYFADANRMYLSSADWMPRNFFSRLEIAFPVKDERLYRYVRDVVIPVYLADVVKGRELTSQGTWRKRSIADVDGRDTPFAKEAVRAQFYFEALANAGYSGTPLARPVAAHG